MLITTIGITKSAEAAEMEILTALDHELLVHNQWRNTASPTGHTTTKRTICQGRNLLVG